MLEAERGGVGVHPEHVARQLLSLVGELARSEHLRAEEQFIGGARPGLEPHDQVRVPLLHCGFHSAGR